MALFERSSDRESLRKSLMRMARQLGQAHTPHNQRLQHKKAVKKRRPVKPGLVGEQLPSFIKFSAAISTKGSSGDP
jgi:hypothetical protein